MASLTERERNQYGIQRGTATWTNWSGHVRALPKSKVTPATEQELAQVIASAKQVRGVGAGHSFSPLCATDETLVSLDELSGIAKVEGEAVSIRAGSRLRPLAELLHARGLGLPNQGDIDHQSVGGAVSTGTHGTGASLPCVSALVTALRMVTANGEIVSLSRSEQPRMFDAARVSLGALGMITEVTMQCMPAYRLRENVSVCKLDEVLRELPSLREKNRHVELFVFPFGRTAILKTLNITDEPADTFAVAQGYADDALLYAACQVGRFSPKANRWIQKSLGSFVSPEQRIGRSSHIFPSERRVRFAEMEYQVPIALGEEALLEVVSAIESSTLGVGFPLEYRFVREDDAWLSPFHGDARASISVHQFHRVEARPLFDLVEPILQRRGGRPHWGKMHTMNARTLAPLYPHWDDFQKLRRELDPTQKFLNSHLRQLFEAN